MGLLAGLAFGLVAWSEARSALALAETGFGGGLGAGLVARLGGAPGAGLLGGLAFGFVAWLGTGLVAGMSRPGTDNTSPLSPLSSWRSDRAFGLVAGLVAGLVVGLAAGLWAWFTFGLWAGLLGGLVVGLVYGLVAGVG